MAYVTLRSFKWGTADGRTVVVAKGVELPEAHSASRKVLDRLYRRGWITDSNGNAFDTKYTTHSTAVKEEPPAPPPVKLEEPEPAVTVEADPKVELAKLKREELDKVATDCGLEPAEYANKEQLVEAILKAGS